MRLLIAALVGLLAVTGTSTRAEEDRPPSEVERQMERISRDLKKLSRQFEDPAKKESSLALVDSALEANAASKKLVPASADGLSGQELEAYMELYQQGLSELEACLQTLREKLSEDDVVAAAESLDQAQALRKRYHKKLL